MAVPFAVDTSTLTVCALAAERVAVKVAFDEPELPSGTLTLLIEMVGPAGP